MKRIFIVFSIIVATFSFAQQKGKDYSQIMKSKNIYEIDAFLRDAHPDDPRRKILKDKLIEMITKYIQYSSPDDQSVPILEEKLVLLKERGSTKMNYEEMNASIKQRQITYYKNQLALIESGQYAEMREETQKKLKRSENELRRMDISNEFYDGLTGKSKKNLSFKEREAAADAAEKKLTNNNIATKQDPEAEEFRKLMNDSPEEHKKKTVGLLNKLFDNDSKSKDVVVMIENKSNCNMIMRIDGGVTKYNLPILAQKENSIVLTKGKYTFKSIICGSEYTSDKSVDKNLVISLKNN